MMKKLISTGAVVALIAVAGGCGGSDTAASGSTTTTAATMSTMDTTTTSMDTATAHLHVTVNGGKTSGDTAPKVKLGQKVMIHITSDTADEAHLHGYDKEIALKANTEAMIEFTADIAGRFEFELHHSGLKVMELTVQ